MIGGLGSLGTLLTALPARLMGGVVLGIVARHGRFAPDRAKRPFSCGRGPAGPPPAWKSDPPSAFELARPVQPHWPRTGPLRMG